MVSRLLQIMSKDFYLHTPERKNFFESIYSKIASSLTPYFMNFTPNQITFFSGILGIIGSLLLVSSNYLNLLFAAILIQLYSVLDLVDGNIARKKNLQSKFGMWLDIFFDKLIDFLIIVFMSLGIYLKVNDANILIMGILLMGVVFFNQFIMVLNVSYFALPEYKKPQSIKGKGKKNILNFIFIIVKFYRIHLSLQHNTFLFLISFFALFNQLTFGIYFLTIHGIISLVLSIIANFIKINK
tara:strand:+ start:1908 stop:2630 length:723 start_codon:yes stop_codon:yes gene_type:complete